MKSGIGVHTDQHQCGFALADVRKILSFWPLRWEGASAIGNLPLRSLFGGRGRRREFPHINFVATGFIRRIRNPASVGRKLSRSLVEARSREGKGCTGPNLRI